MTTTMDLRSADGAEGFYEIVAGQLVEKPPMGAFEAWIASRLVEILAPFVTTQRLGRVVSEMLFEINPGTGLKRRPDVAFVSFERWPRGRSVPRERFWNVVPDLAVEVISPTNNTDDDLAKIDEYFDCGVSRVWWILPNRLKLYDFRKSTVVQILTPTDSLDGEPILPGFRLPLSELFFEEGTETET